MAPATTQHRTACPLDCPDGCSLTVDVQEGRLVSVDATPPAQAANPLTAGFICHKVKHHALRVHGPDRVMTPLLRTGPKGSGSFRPATWDEAMDLVVTRLRQAMHAHGPQSVLPYLYNSSAGVLAAATLGPQVSAELGFARLQHTICAATLGAAKSIVLGNMPSADPLDIVHSRHLVVWGANPTIANTHLPPLVSTAVRQHGARLVVIDPRRTAMAARAHRHLAVRPGTDVVLAAAMARHLERSGLVDLDFVSRHAVGFDALMASCDQWSLDRAADVTGVSATDIAETAEEWAAAKPSMLRIGWGLERNRNGGAGCTTVLALPVLMGHFGTRGSGILHSTTGGNAVDTTAFSRPGSVPSDRIRYVSQNRLGQALDPDASQGEPFISALIIQGANPALMNLDQRAVLAGLRRHDLFTVVHDQVLTDTALYADVVLPATTHYEAADLADSYGSYLVQAFPAVIDRVGESRTNTELWADLGIRMGITGLDGDAAALTPMIATPRPVGEVRTPGSTMQMVDVHPGYTDRRFRLVPISYVHVPVAGRQHALTLLSPAGGTTINSVFGERRTERPTVVIHPDDASDRGITDGMAVSVHNDLASIEVDARVSDEVRPGVASITKGFWARAYGSPGGLTVNALIPAEVEPLAGGACFNDARVEITPVAVAAHAPDPAGAATIG